MSPVRFQLLDYFTYYVPDNMVAPHEINKAAHINITNAVSKYNYYRPCNNKQK